jgi:hypothetical protein
LLKSYKNGEDNEDKVLVEEERGGGIEKGVNLEEFDSKTQGHKEMWRQGGWVSSLS